MSIKLTQKFITNNKYYQRNVGKSDSRYTKFQKNGPQGGMLHSVGCPQPRASVFANSWNKSTATVAVHAVIQEDGTGFQCLPWNFRGIHAGGSANNTHIGVEMTEPSCIRYTKGAVFTCSDLDKARAHARGCYEAAVELFAQLSMEFGWDPMVDIIGHREGHKLGVASNHGDPEHLWSQLGLPYTMDTFREDVAKAMNTTHFEAEMDGPGLLYTGPVDAARSFNKAKAGTYVVDSSDGTLNLRAGADKDKPLVEEMKSGTKVKCYGYYTGKWLLVVSEQGNKGFCHEGYLNKV